MMYNDEVEESLNEEIIRIIMQDQGSENTEPVRILPTIAPPRPPVREVFSRTPSPRFSPFHSPDHSPCPSPRPSSPIHSNNILRTINSTGAETLSPSTAKWQKRPPHTEPHVMNGESENPVSNPSTEVQEENSKKTHKNCGPKFDSNTSSSSKAAIFRSRLFGLSYTGASESPTLPSTSNTTSSNNAKTSSSHNTSNLQLFAEPPMSPATITDSPFPPSEPMELQYFEVIYHITATHKQIF